MVNGIGLGVQSPQVIVVREGNKGSGRTQLGNAAQCVAELGAIDVGIIGTHKLMKKSAKFDNLCTKISENVSNVIQKLSKKFPARTYVDKVKNGPSAFIGHALQKESKFGRLLEKLAKEFKDDARNATGKYAVLTAGLLGTCLILKHVFTAGKIAGEKQ